MDKPGQAGTQPAVSDLTARHQDQIVTAKINGGGSGLRATGEMSWAMADSRDFEQFFTYESELHRMTSPYAPTLLCLFVLDDLDGPALDNVLRTHPTIIYAHGVIDNPYNRSPDEPRKLLNPCAIAINGHRNPARPRRSN